MQFAYCYFVMTMDFTLVDDENYGQLLAPFVLKPLDGFSYYVYFNYLLIWIILFITYRGFN